MYIMVPEPILTVYFINPSPHSVCLYVSPIIVASQRLGRHVPAAENTSNSGRTVGRVIFSEISIVLKESRRLLLPRTSFYICKVCITSKFF
jgi:hypothetical protein